MLCSNCEWHLGNGGWRFHVGARETRECVVCCLTGSPKSLYKQCCFLTWTWDEEFPSTWSSTAETVLPSVYVCHEDMIDKSWQQGGGEVEDSVGLVKDSFRERHAV